MLTQVLFYCIFTSKETVNYNPYRKVFYYQKKYISGYFFVTFIGEIVQIFSVGGKSILLDKNIISEVFNNASEIGVHSNPPDLSKKTRGKFKDHL